jgi:hypothetical protein
MMRCSFQSVRANLHTGWLLLGALGLVATLTACETPLERAYGLSQRAHVARTIQNPDAGIEDLEARPIDGASTEAALGKHRGREIQGDDTDSGSVINVDIGG